MNSDDDVRQKTGSTHGMTEPEENDTSLRPTPIGTELWAQALTSPKVAAALGAVLFTPVVLGVVQLFHLFGNLPRLPLWFEAVWSYAGAWVVLYMELSKPL